MVVSSERAMDRELSTGKALTTASAARPDRTAKKEKRIVIELRIRGSGVSLSSLVD